MEEVNERRCLEMFVLNPRQRFAGRCDGHSNVVDGEVSYVSDTTDRELCGLFLPWMKDVRDVDI